MGQLQSKQVLFQSITLFLIELFLGYEKLFILNILSIDISIFTRNSILITKIQIEGIYKAKYGLL